MRLINADALREGWLEWNPYEIIEANTVLENIDQQPTIDAEPVKHGRWENCFTQDGEEVGYCSECQAVRFLDLYCPNCGAKMDKEVEA